MNIETKKSQEELNLQRKLEWVGCHDSKTAFANGTLIGMLGLPSSASSKVETWTFMDYIIFGIPLQNKFAFHKTKSILTAFSN